MGVPEITRFLTSVAVDGRVAASTPELGAERAVIPLPQRAGAGGPMARRPGARTLAAAAAVVLTDRAPAPVQDAPYSQAIRLGDLIFISKQLALQPGTTPDGRRDEQTERVPTNLKAILEAAAAASTVSSRPPCFHRYGQRLSSLQPDPDPVHGSREHRR